MMLEIDIVLNPFGMGTNKHTLESMMITNTGNHPKSPDYGNYVFKVEGSKPLRIKNYDRKKGALYLLYLCLHKYFKGDI